MMGERAMRAIIPALIAMLLLAAPVEAQRRTSHVIRTASARRDPLPRFTITPRGGPLPRIGLPLPQIGLQPWPRKAGEPWHWRGVEAWRHRRHVRSFGWPVVFYVPQPVPVMVAAPEITVKRIEPAPAAGRLILDVTPSGAEIFADGYYVGVPADFSAARGGGILEAGLHRIDVSASGHEPVTVNLRVAAGQSLTYRAALKALPPPVAVPPTTFYMIPGCYMGNIPPKEAHLPASCDHSRTVSWRP